MRSSSSSRSRPPDCWFLLTSSEPERVLATIRSRATGVFVPPVAESEVFSFLRAHTPATEKEIRKVTRLSEGSVGRALGFLSTEEEPGSLERSRQDAFFLMKAALDPSPVARFRQALERPPAKARQLHPTLAALGAWLRDLAALAARRGRPRTERTRPDAGLAPEYAVSKTADVAVPDRRVRTLCGGGKAPRVRQPEPPTHRVPTPRRPSRGLPSGNPPRPAGGLMTDAHEGDAPLTHLDREGRPKMVDVSGKQITNRWAKAEGSIRNDARHACEAGRGRPKGGRASRRRARRDSGSETHSRPHPAMPSPPRRLGRGGDHSRRGSPRTPRPERSPGRRDPPGSRWRRSLPSPSRS